MSVISQRRCYSGAGARGLWLCKGGRGCCGEIRRGSNWKRGLTNRSQVPVRCPKSRSRGEPKIRVGDRNDFKTASNISLKGPGQIASKKYTEKKSPISYLALEGKAQTTYGKPERLKKRGRGAAPVS